jgi:hypothetical protein
VDVLFHLLGAVENALGRIRNGSFSNARRQLLSAQVPGNRIKSVACEEVGHLGGGRGLAGELVDAESLKDQAQCALVLIKRLRLEIWFAIGADDHGGNLTSAMIKIA